MYSLDFRHRVLLIRQKENLTIVETAIKFHVGIATIKRWIKDINPKLKRNKPATKIDTEALKLDIKKYRDAYNYERAKRLNVGTTTVFDALKRLGITYKKNSKSSKSQRRRKAILPKKYRVSKK